MTRSFRCKLLSIVTALSLGCGVVGCTPSQETISSVIDLAATTSAGFVEIVVRAVAEGILSLGQDAVDLTAPLSEQDA